MNTKANLDAFTEAASTASLKEKLSQIITEIEASAGSDPSFDTNRTLKKGWAKRLKEVQNGI